MPTRQSVLALYGAASDGLAKLDFESTRGRAREAHGIRTAAREMLGLTGSAGERGLYRELLRYFNRPEQRVGDEPVSAATPEEIRDDLLAGEALPPSWAARAIDAAYVRDRTSDFLGESEDTTPRLLAPALSAAPAGTEGSNRSSRLGFNRSSRVESTFAQQISDELRSDARSALDLRTAMVKYSGTISSAVARQDIKPVLRKVKGEYCAVVTTEAYWDDIGFNELKLAINPDNWDKYYANFFCAMTPLADKDSGWTRVREEVSGECDRYRLRTALKFWSGLRGKGMFLNYDLDSDRYGTDSLVLVDNGYLWIEPQDPDNPGNGVHVRTSKQLLISGMSATAMTAMASTMGWATNAADMFYNAVQYSASKGAVPLAAFEVSKPDSAEKPKPDLSTAWPVIVPHVPGDIRDEMCRDTTEIVKDALDTAYDFAGDYAGKWKNGIDLPDFEDLSQTAADDVKEFSIKVFEKATENFRPKPATKGP
jgi:hypothetical protein